MLYHFVEITFENKILKKVEYDLNDKTQLTEEMQLKTFEEMNLIAPLQRALKNEQYKTPTPIQAKTIPVAISGRDVLGCAQTGTGKTAAFALPILNHLGQRNRKAVSRRPFVLVLAPTRELAIQIANSFSTYGKHLKLRQALVYGGVGQGNQVRAMNRGAHILVATPGRLLDLMNQDHINLDQIEMVVLDEADRMLDMGFLPDVKRILSRLPGNRQTLFFSATMPPSIDNLAKRMLTQPVKVQIQSKSVSVDKIEQKVLFLKRDKKQESLQSIVTADDAGQVLVFTKTKRGADAVARKLDRSGIKTAAIHGNKSQNARQRALDAFRAYRVQVLVATDVAARGIDVDGITHVVNFDLPIDPESYVHRIGRTGRAGASGIAISFCTDGERRELREIQKLLGNKVRLITDHSHSPSEQHPRSSMPHAKGSTTPRSTPRRPSSRRSSTRPFAQASTSNGKPKNKRKQRKGRNARLRIKQASK